MSIILSSLNLNSEKKIFLKAEVYITMKKNIENVWNKKRRKIMSVDYCVKEVSLELLDLWEEKILLN